MSRKTVKKHGKLLTVLGLTVALLGIYILIPQSYAASIDNRKITLTDSRPDAGANVSYTFEGDHSTTSVTCLELIFCANASGACGEATGMDASTASSVSSGWSGWTYADWTASVTTATRIAYTTGTATPGGTDFAFVTASITNPTTAGTYFARAATYADAEACAATATDTGVAAFAIVSGVTVSATVAETLTLSIVAVTQANCDATYGDISGVDSTAATIPYGTLTNTNTFYHACQDVHVATNGSGGYTLTGQETQELRDSSANVNIADSTGDSTSMSQSVSSVWETATNNGFGYACKDLQGGNCSMVNASSNRQFACVSSDTNLCPSASESAVSVMATSAAVSATSRIRYKLTISDTQAAGTYSNVVVYIATPTF